MIYNRCFLFHLIKLAASGTFSAFQLLLLILYHEENIEIQFLSFLLLILFSRFHVRKLLVEPWSLLLLNCSRMFIAEQITSFPINFWKMSIVTDTKFSKQESLASMTQFPRNSQKGKFIWVFHKPWLHSVRIFSIHFWHFYLKKKILTVKGVVIIPFYKLLHL